MTKQGWRSTIVRKELYEQMQEIIETNTAPRSISAFVNEAIKEKLDRFKKKGVDKEEKEPTVIGSLGSGIQSLVTGESRSHAASSS